MIKKMFYSVAILAAAVSLGGCAQYQGMMTKLEEADAASEREAYTKFSDPQLAQAFYSLENAGKVTKTAPAMDKIGYELAATRANSVHFSRRIVQEAGWQFAMDTFGSFRNRSMLDDPAGAKYVEVAHARGNTVRLYKPLMGRKINSMYEQFHYLDPDKNTREWGDIDNALVEVNPNGEVVSFLTKSYQGILTIGVSIKEYVHVYFGPTLARHFENQITNDFFAQTIIRELPPTAVAKAETVAAPRVVATAEPAKPLATPAAKAGARPTCAANEILVRYTSIKPAQSVVRVEATIVKTGKKTFSNYPLDVFAAQAPKVGQFKCWDNEPV